MRRRRKGKSKSILDLPSRGSFLVVGAMPPLVKEKDSIAAGRRGDGLGCVGPPPLCRRVCCDIELAYGGQHI